MNTVIIGARGRLGRAFQRRLPGAMALGRQDLDLARLCQLRSTLAAFDPSLIINCAAYTAVDAAEDDEETATLINGQAVGELAALAAWWGVPFVTYSTDYVFDGTAQGPYTESAVPAPLNAYGRSKLVGEELALEHPGSLIIRTSWLLSATHPSFLSTILGRATTGSVDVVDDQWGRPTTVDDLAVATVAAIDAGVTGVLHLASPPTTSWFGLAQEACRFAGLDPNLIKPIMTTAIDRRAQRPRGSVLGSERGFEMPDWRLRVEEWLRHDALLIGSENHPVAGPEST